VAEQNTQLEQSKVGGWLRNLAGVFVVIDEEKKETTATPTNTNPTPNFAGKNSPPPSTTTYVPPAADDFVADLQARFKKILEEKNQPGFDFYEFSMMLLRTSSSPSVEHFKTAFEGAKLMNPNCSQKFLLDSATFYKTELQKAFESTVAAGEQKKNTLSADKQKEQQQLNAEVSNIEKQLAKLRQDIANLEKTQTEKITALNGIDAKFQDKFVEIEQKIQATVQAKDGVAAEIGLIENGIKQYLA
jgi:hypothetical protein